MIDVAWSNGERFIATMTTRRERRLSVLTYTATLATLLEVAAMDVSPKW